MEALRRQDEIRRQQAYMAMQQAAAHNYSASASHHRTDHRTHDESGRTYSPMVASKELRASSSSEEEEEDHDEQSPVSHHHESVEELPIAPAPPEAEADEEAEVFIVEEAPPPKKKRPTPKKPRPSAIKPKKSPPKAPGPSIEDPFPRITREEYENVEKLMMQFCRVPLLAEFSRPVSLLHPELMGVYTKIVKHPMDLGRVCRDIRRRSYRDTRAIRMDMWRIFSNCIKYHTHPSNRENAVPAFISISLHLRDYFNALWQEYMLPSDPPSSGAGGKQPRGLTRAAFDQRETDRIQRLTGTGTTILSKKCIEKLSLSLHRFLASGGRVDSLDVDPVIGEYADDDDDEGHLEIFASNVEQLRKRLQDLASGDVEYTVDEMVRDINRCYSVDVFDNRPSIRVRIGNRLDRMIGKIIVPIYETSCRGVNQSSIWGCMAAAIWARESSKKPYWPALVLGIMAPDCQRETWHSELTARNEARFPEKLLAELQAGKRKAEQSLKRDTKLGPQQLSYFLVEFMGTHEFIWVKEGDIIETFDPDEDPNTASAAGSVTKKKRSSRNITDSKTFLTAIEEGRWALEEFELQLSDACGDQTDEEDADDEQEMNYSYAVLSQSDDEAEEEEEEQKDDQQMTASDIEEANEMLASDGLIDYSIEGRKNARKRSLARKKEKVNADKAAAKREKTEQAKKAKDKKSKNQKEAPDRKKKEAKPRKEENKEDRRPKKRKAAKEQTVKSKKKRRIDTRIDPRGKLTDKRGRATAIVNGYLTRTLKKEEMKNLCLAGVLNIPASVVDSSGLLGMALAFRAAAGEIPMPDDADTRFKPWQHIDVEGPKTSAERTKNLEMQLDIILKKVEEVKEFAARRREMTQLAIEQRHRIEEEILAQEIAAKKQVMSRALKKKPVVKAEPKSGGALLEGTVVDGDENDGQVVEVVVEDGGAVEADTSDHDEEGDAEAGDASHAMADDEEIEVEEVDDVDDVEDAEVVEADVE